MIFMVNQSSLHATTAEAVASLNDATEIGESSSTAVEADMSSAAAEVSASATTAQ